MRNAFISRLTELADRDERVVLITADLGFGVLERFADRHPRRYLNVGVAEANMIGVAAGMASQGFIPFCYSIATFASMRGYEQVRNTAVLHRLRVRIVGVGGGFAYGSAGITHHALEDLAIMRVQPGMGVAAPADDAQAVAALDASWERPGPWYHRLGKDSQHIEELGGRFRIGRLEQLGDASEVVLVTTGAITATALAAARRLCDEGVACSVAVAASIAPAPVDDLTALARSARLLVSVEDHYAVGGLGSLVAECVAATDGEARLVRLGVTEPHQGRSGSERFLREREGLSAEGIAATVRTAL